MFGTADSRHPRGQIRLGLEEGQVPPRLLLGVVHLAPARPHSGHATAIPSESPSADQAGAARRRTEHPPPATAPEDQGLAGTGRHRAYQAPDHRGSRSPAASQVPRTATHSEPGGAYRVPRQPYQRYPSTVRSQVAQSDFGRSDPPRGLARQLQQNDAASLTT
jgi:hypothetical protein